MNVEIPKDFREVEREDFEAYLTCCADYHVGHFINTDVYSFRGTNLRFAYVKHALGQPVQVFVNPSILAKSV